MDTLIGSGEQPLRPGPVQGLTIRRRGEPLAAVRTKMSTFSLLTTSPQGETMVIDLLPGGHLDLTPDSAVDETFYVVSGRLRCELPQPAILRSGDVFSTQELKAPVLLEALSAVQLFYTTDTPQFCNLDEDVRVLRGLAAEVELKDGYTAEHCDRLQSLSYATARELALPGVRLHLLDYGSYLHDVGKLHVPLAILNKPGKLTPAEWAVIKKHPTYGRELLDGTFMREAGVIVEQHHERFDGSGYPYGLAGDEISVEAAIIAVSDTFDAMTTDRPYAAARTEAEAIAELRRYAGIHYHSEVVRAFCASLERAARGLFET